MVNILFFSVINKICSWNTYTGSWKEYDWGPYLRIFFLFNNQRSLLQKLKSYSFVSNQKYLFEMKEILL